jgi:hypothetical protein
VLGETIRYKIIVTNTGNLTVSGISVTDSLSTAKGRVIGMIESLAPGEESEAFAFDHMVTAADILKGSVVNEAGAAGTTEPEKTPVQATSNQTVDATMAEPSDDPPAPTKPAAPYSLKIHYVYLDGTTAAPTHAATLAIGDAYDVASPELPGYTASLVRVTGTMPARNVIYTVIYLKEGTTLVPLGGYEVPLNIGSVGMSVGDCFE